MLRYIQSVVIKWKIYQIYYLGECVLLVLALKKAIKNTSQMFVISVSIKINNNLNFFQLACLLKNMYILTFTKMLTNKKEL